MRKNRRYKVWLPVFVIVLSLSVLGGCVKENTQANKTEQSADTKNDLADSSSQVVSDIKDSSKQDQPAVKELPVYGLNEETLEREPVTALVPEESTITAEFVVQTVLDIFEERSITVEIDSVVSEEDTVIVSFKSGGAPVVDTASNAESGILDSISMSLLDNVESCQKVIFRIEGKAYETDYMVYGLDEPYKTLNK